MKKRILSILIALAMVLTLMPGVAFATAEKIGNSNVTWELSDDGKTLTIGGTNAMPNYDDEHSWPWNDSKSKITTVIIESGVTSIGPHAFQNMSNLTSVAIPVTVTKIEGSAFTACQKLTNVIVEAINSPTLGSNVFLAVPPTLEIYVPAASVEAYRRDWHEYASSIVGYSVDAKIHDGIVFEPWKASEHGGKLPTTVGNYYLNEDVTLSSTWNVTAGAINLDLNGHVINANGGSFSAITIPSGATLNLYDCGTINHAGYIDADGLWHLGEPQNGETVKNITGGVITGGKASSGGGVFVSDGGKFTMNGGTIAGCQAIYEDGDDSIQGGGGVYVDKEVGNGGIFTMNSGTIKGCIATNNGGGVFNRGTFTMYAGSIQECKTLSTSTKGLGGGVCNFDNATFTLSGGTIQNNTASRYGGGVSNTGDGTVNITSGSIINNTAENNNNGGGGGGINSDGNVTITGGIIANNTAAKDGGGVRFNGDNKKLTINDGTIEKNDAVGAGGVWSKGTVIMTGGAIKNNTSDGWGGGVQVAGGSFEMTDGNITGNVVDDGGDGGGVYIGGGGTFIMNRGSITQNSLGDNGWGGGVYIGGGGTFTVTNGSITKNNAVEGGGVNIDDGTFNATNSEISENIASGNGGGVNITNGIFNATNSDISENKASNKGGAVYADTEGDSELSVTTMTNCQICGNESKWGGGIFINKGNVTAANCQITGNTASSGGGAVEIENDECTFTMNGGSINENSVTEVNGGLHKGAGVHFNKGTFAIKGEVNITNNKCDDVDSNVYLRTNPVTFNVAEMDTKSSIGVFAAGAEDGSETKISITDGSDDTNYLACFSVDDIPVSNGAAHYAYALRVDDNKQISLYQVSHTHGTGGDAIPFEAWNASEHEGKLLPDTAGSYYLTEDVTLSEMWTVKAGTAQAPAVTNLCLNGHVIKLDTDKNGSVITVPANATLNLYDCGTTEHYFTVDDNGLWKLTGTKTELTKTVTGGVITGGNASASGKQNGGGVNVSGTFTMNGGNIVGNTASRYGGGVYDNGTFNMNGGSIVGNTADSGGGVYVYENKTFTMIGGNIVSNTVSTNGGGVSVDNDGATVTLGGTAQIIENFRVKDGVKTAYNYYVLGYKNNNNRPIKTFSLGTGNNAPKSGMKVGITMQCTTGGEFTTSATETQVGYFTPDDSTFGARLGSAGGIELAKLYAITKDGITNGTVTTDATANKAFEGDTVTLTVTPNSGYQLKANTLKATYDENGEEEGGEKSCELAGTGDTYTFTMPAYAVTVTAEFETVPAPAPSSGGGSSSTITVPVSGDANSVKISATVSGSTATIKPIKDADLAKVADGESVAIDLSGAGKNVDTAKIPTETVEKISEKSALTVKLPVATVEFDNAATAEIADQAKGNNIELVVDSVKEVSLNAVQKESVKKLDTALIIDAHLVSNGERLCSESEGGFGGGKATVILPYEIKDNRTAANYSVYYVDDAGKLQKLAAKYDEELAAFVFEIEHFSVYAVAYDENACEQDATCVYAKFTDADTKAWYHDGVHFCVKNGYMQGVSADKFAPNGTLSRAMIVTMLWRMEGEPIVNCAMTFKDVKADQWYTEAIRWAQSNKIVEGYSADSFGPDDDVTREQLAAILYRYAQAKGEGFTGSWMFLLDLVDRADISSWADEAVHWCSMKGIVNGKDGKVFDPQGKATRAEAAAMIQRFCENILSK